MNRKKALLKDLRSPFAKSFLSAIQNISELESKSPIVVENQSIKENIDCIRIKIRNDSLSQYPKYDIKNEEILDIEFDCRDENIPKVYIVRKDFPLIAHTLIDEDDRLYLCLYENSWDDIRLSWNPRDFIRRLLIWFNDAAQGKLHREAQPLEAYIFPYCNAHLILPSDLLFGLKEGKLFGPIEFNNCFQVNNDLYAYPNKVVTSKAVFLSLNFPERANLGVSKMPKTLGDLASIIDFNEVKLYDLINNAFQSNEFNSIEDENVHLWLILNLSLSRADDGVSEKIVKVAVRICNSLPDLLRDYGIFEIDPESKKYVKLLHTDIKEDRVDILNTIIRECREEVNINLQDKNLVESFELKYISLPNEKSNAYLIIAKGNLRMTKKELIEYYKEYLTYLKDNNLEIEFTRLHFINKKNNREKLNRLKNPKRSYVEELLEIDSNNKKR